MLHLHALLLIQPEDAGEAVAAGVFHEKVHFGRVAQDAELQAGEEQLCHQDEDGGKQAALVESGTQGQTDDGGGPQAGGGGQTLHPLAAGDDDGAGADEADAGDDLCAQTGQVGGVVHHQAQVLAGEGGDGSAQTDEDVGAEAGGAALELALDADDAAADESQKHTQQNGTEGKVPHRIKQRHHSNGTSFQISLMLRMWSSWDRAASTSECICFLRSRMARVALGLWAYSLCPWSMSTS